MRFIKIVHDNPTIFSFFPNSDDMKCRLRGLIGGKPKQLGGWVHVSPPEDVELSIKNKQNYCKITTGVLKLPYTTIYHHELKVHIDFVTIYHHELKVHIDFVTIYHH